MTKEYKNLNILFTTHGSPDYLSAIKFSKRQIIVSPNYQTEIVNGEYKSIKTSNKTYDIQEIISLLPKSQQPDLLIVLVDSFFGNTPLNLHSLDIPKLCLIADIHHGLSPIQNIIKYLNTEIFDDHLLLFTPQHSHFFSGIGIDNIGYIPNVNTQYFEIPFQKERTRKICFVGQIGQFHPRRTRLFHELQQRGYPVEALRCPADQVFSIYGQHQIIFNCSLNGDLNMRVFEALGARGFLITDRLCTQCGIAEHFIDGEDLVYYDNIDDLCQKLDYYLQNPKVCLNIAQNGYKKYLDFFLPERQIKRVLDLIFDKENADLNYVINDQRNLYLKSLNIDDFFARLKFYEAIQEVNLKEESYEIFFSSDIDPCLISDISDLMRIKIFYSLGHPHPQAMDLFSQVQIKDRINFVDNKFIENNKFDLIL